MDDCHTQVGHAVLKDELFYVSVAMILQVHFTLVLFTHYKNAHLTKAKGGCQQNVDPDIQMGNVVESMEDSNAT